MSETRPIVDQRLAVTGTVFEIIRSGRSQELITWKHFDKKVAQVELFTPAEESTIIMRVLSQDVVGKGYLPRGYPATHRTTGPAQRLILIPA
jgi:hypothetical protein